MAKVPENFLMQRRMNGMDAYLPASDIAAGDVADSTNLYSYDGEWYSRWGKQACFVSPPSNNPNYGATEFLRSDGSTVIVFCNDGKLYYAVAGTPPFSWTEITINGGAFSLDSANVQMKKAGLYLYVIDGSGPLYRILVNADGSFISSECSALSVPDSPAAILSNTVLDEMDVAGNWSSFPLLTWLNTPVNSSNQNTIGNQENWLFNGASTSDNALPPQGWLTGGDSMDFQAGSPGGMEPKMDGSGDPRGEWVDWDYPVPYYGSQNTIGSARVWVAGATTHSGNGATAFFQMQLYPEAASVDSPQTSSTTTYATNITNATTAKPIVVTAAGHALHDGQQVTIAGVGGNTAANNTVGSPNWYVKVTGYSTSTFALYSDYALTQPVDGTSSGAYTSGGTVTVTAPKAYTDLTTSNGNNTLYSAARPFSNTGGNQNAGDVGKVVSILTSSGSVTAGNYTITSVSAGGVATVNGNVSSTSTSNIVGVMALDSGFDGSNDYGAGNWTLAQSIADGTMPSGVVGAVQNSGNLTATPSGAAYKKVFTWSSFDQDFDYLKYRIFGPSNTSVQGVNTPTLTPVDVRLNVSVVNGLLHLAANDPIGGGLGANCLAGVWIKRDYTGGTGTTGYTDLAIHGSDTSTVTSSANPFQSSQVGQVLLITGGTNWIAGSHTITAVDSSHVATLSTAAATSNTATGGTGYCVQDFSKDNVVSIGFSAPETTPQIPFRLGFLKAGQPMMSGPTTCNIIWSNPVTYAEDGKSFYVDISTVDVTDADARAQTAYLFLRVENDLPNTINPADLCTLGPLTGAGNLSVGLADYHYVGVAVRDYKFGTDGSTTTDDIDGVVLSDPSGPSTPAITPSNYQAQAYVTFDNSYYSASGNSDVNWLWVYRFGGALAGANVTTYTSYILLDQCPRWSGSPGAKATVSAAGGVGGGSWTWTGIVWQSSDGYRTWNPSTYQLVDNTPDLALIGNDFLNSGRGKPPMGAKAIELWNNRLVLAVGSTLYISDLLSTNSAAGLYYATTVDPEDPYAATKGGIYPVEANDNDGIVQLKTHGQYLDIFKQKSVHLMTGQDPVSGFQITPHLKDAGIGLVGGPLAVCGFDLNVAFVGPSAVHEYKAEPVHFSFGILQAYEDAEQAPIISQKIEPLIAPFLKGGTPIAPSAYRNMVLHYQGRRLWLFAPVAGESTNSVAYVFDTRPATDGSGPVGWTRLTNFNIVSCCSLSSQSDSDDLYLGGADGQLYKLTGNADVSYVSDATNASPIVVTTSGAHGLSNGQKVIVASVGGNTAANGTWYAGSATSTTFALYQDAALTMPVAGNGSYTSGGTASATIAWNVTSRGFMNETNDFRYFKANRPTRAYFLVSTNESAPVTFGVSVVGGTGGSGQPASFSTTYTIDGQFADVRFKVPAEVRGYGAVQVSVSGSTSTQSRVTAFGVEDAKGAIRGNV